MHVFILFIKLSLKYAFLGILEYCVSQSYALLCADIPLTVPRKILDILVTLNENVWIPIKISIKFVPKGPINNIPA